MKLLSLLLVVPQLQLQDQVLLLHVLERLHAAPLYLEVPLGPLGRRPDLLNLLLQEGNLVLGFA